MSKNNFKYYTNKEIEMEMKPLCDALKREMLKGRRQNKSYMLMLSELIDMKRQLMY